MAGALEGIRIVDFTWVLAGPAMTRYLADYGATVVHVESSIWMDILRQGPPFKDGVVGLNRSGWFNNYNRNKLGMTLNLKHPQGVEVFKKMVAWADVVVSGAGSTCWEILFMGLPSVVLTLAENQRQIADCLVEQGVAVSLGWYRDVSVEAVAEAIEGLLDDPARRWAMSDAGRVLVDGRGAERLLSEGLQELWRGG